MGHFDQTARQAAKHDGPGFFAWQLGLLTPPPPLAFERWDDTRRLVIPGTADRTDDLVAILRRTDSPDRQAYRIVEIQTEPERFLFQRVGVYELLLSMEVAPPPGPENEPSVNSVVLCLTGELPVSGLALTVAGTDLGTWVRPQVVNLRTLNAAATLADIAAGKLAWCVLPWIPLMAGGGNPSLIAEWKRVVLLEPDERSRVLYRDWALIFAELTRELVNWQQALEGWLVKESVYITSWINEGKQRGIVEKGRADLLKVLATRFQSPVPETIRLAVEGTNDPATLDRWFDQALQANSLADFRDAMKETP